VGFCGQEEDAIRGIVHRFRSDGFQIDELVKIKKIDLPGYEGKVVPRRIGGKNRLKMDMLLATTNPFTVAHELAHVSDISVRRRDSMDNLSASQPAPWHLAYKMFAEYYANRVACDYASEADIVAAFRSDLRGWLIAIARKDWASYFYYYSLILGILHGTGRPNSEPLRLFAPKSSFVPARIVKGMVSFRRQAPEFYDTY
jgi:hypothetical protein